MKPQIALLGQVGQTVVVVFLIAIAAVWVPESAGADDKVIKLLEAGRYQEVVALDKKDGHWAFARYFLLPDKATREAAQRASEKGDLFGKFVLMNCQMEGVGVRRSIPARWKLNDELRTAILKKPEKTPLDSYMLSHLSNADAKGEIDSTKFDKPEDAFEIDGRTSEEHLLVSAKRGVAQAMDELGQSAQSEDPDQAQKWFNRAAKLGLASAMKNLGYVLALAEDEKDRWPAEAVKWTRKGAEAGDIFAMINMGAFQERLQLEGISEEEAQKWIRHSSETGHPFGFMEHGLALLREGYGFEKDEKKGIELLQAAANSGHATALYQISTFYAEGLGVDKDLKKTAEFGKAAWVQGNQSASRIIAYAYREEPDLAKDEDAASYWGTHAAGKGLAFAMGIDDDNPEIMKELEKLDPFSVIVK